MNISFHFIFFFFSIAYCRLIFINYIRFSGVLNNMNIEPTAKPSFIANPINFDKLKFSFQLHDLFEGKIARNKSTANWIHFRFDCSICKFGVRVFVGTHSNVWCNQEIQQCKCILDRICDVCIRYANVRCTVKHNSKYREITKKKKKGNKNNIRTTYFDWTLDKLWSLHRNIELAFRKAQNDQKFIYVHCELNLWLHHLFAMR